MATGPKAAPSVAGTAFGVSWAGLGLGALAGLAVAPGVDGGADLPERARQLGHFYGAIFAAMATGMALGVLAGGAYAWRHRRAG